MSYVPSNQTFSIVPLARRSTVTPQQCGGWTQVSKKPSKCRKLREAWKYYCHTARVAGLPYLGGYKKNSCLSRICGIGFSLCFFTAYRSLL